MCDKIKIVNAGDDKIEIYSPYNPDFVAKVKAAGARWNPAAKAWMMRAADADVAREILHEVYGLDNGPDAAVNLVRVRVTALQDASALRRPITLCGRVVASAYGRDSGARVGDDVSFTCKAPVSGGSVKNWRTVIPAGSVFVMGDVPENLLNELECIDSYGERVYSYEIVPDGHDEQLRKLQARREELAATLADVDAQIATLSRMEG